MKKLTKCVSCRQNFTRSKTGFCFVCKGRHTKKRAGATFPSTLSADMGKSLARFPQPILTEKHCQVCGVKEGTLVPVVLSNKSGVVMCPTHLLEWFTKNLKQLLDLEGNSLRQLLSIKELRIKELERRLSGYEKVEEEREERNEPN